MKKRRKSLSPKMRDTIIRMWNDLRKTHDLDISKVKNHSELVSLVSKYNENYAEYIYYNKNSKSIIQSQYSNLFDEKGNVFNGKTALIRKAISGIRNKNITVKESEESWSFYGKRGKLLKTVRKDNIK